MVMMIIKNKICDIDVDLVYSAQDIITKLRIILKVPCVLYAIRIQPLDNHITKNKQMLTK